MRMSFVVALALSACVAESEDGLSPDDGFDDTVGDGKSDISGVSVHTVHRFSDAKLYPEGGAFDPVERAFYVGSLSHGSITRIAADGTESTFNAGGEADRFTLGMQVDAARRLLWVCSTKDSLGRVTVYDLATREQHANIDLTTVNPEGACNDVLLDRDGSALVSDRENSHIYKIDTAYRLSIWAHDPLLGGKVVSLNSMDFTEDHSAVLTATYLAPALVRVSTSNPRDVRKVKLSGSIFMDGFNVLNGPDDLVMHDGELVVAFGSSIKHIVPDDASWTRAHVTSERTIGGVTALVEDGDDHLYAINGQSVRFALHLPPNPFQIFQLD